MVADHAEGGRADMALDGVGLGEGQGARRRVRIGPLEEDVEQDVRIEQDAQRFAAAKRGFKIRRHRAAARASLPAPKPNFPPAPPNC